MSAKMLALRTATRPAGPAVTTRQHIRQVSGPLFFSTTAGRTIIPKMGIHLDDRFRKMLHLQTHPGYKLFNWLCDIEMTQRELALRCGVSEAHISAICSGQKKITALMAQKQEYVLGISAAFLLAEQTENCTALYNSPGTEETSARERRLANKLSIYQEVISSGEPWAHCKKEFHDPVFALRRALKKNNLTNIPALARATDPRLEKIKDSSLVQVFAWFMISDQLNTYAANREAPPLPFNRDKLQAKLPAISTLTAGRPLQEAMPALIKTFRKCSITLKTFMNVPDLSAGGYSKKSAGASLLLCIKAIHEDPARHRFELFHLLRHIANGDLDHTALLIDHDHINDAAAKKAGRFAVQFV